MIIKAVIFDLDGTLIDSMSLWRRVDCEFLGSRNIPVPADLFAHLPAGNSFIQTAQYFKDRFLLPDSVESIMQEWTDMVRHHYETDIELKNGVRELIHLLSAKGIKIGLGTSNSYELAEKVLSQNGIWHYFQTAVTGDMDVLGKPFPDIYLRVADNLHVLPQECIVIEDTLSGVRAGKSAGMTVLAIYDQDSEPEMENIKSAADHFFYDYVALSNTLEREYLDGK